MERINSPKVLIKNGQKVKSIWKHAAEKYSLSISVGGLDPLATLSFNGERSMLQMTVFTQLLLEQGFLASGANYATVTYKEKDFKDYEIAVNKAFRKISNNYDNLEKIIYSDVKHTGFQRLT